MVKCDWMHAADMGILSYELGELWWSCLPELGATTARAEGFKVLKDKLKRHYRSHPRSRTMSKVPMKRLTLTKVKPRDGNPKLKAKAAQTRHLLDFSRELAEELRGNALGENRFQSISALKEIYDLANQDTLTFEDLQRWRGLAVMHMYLPFAIIIAGLEFSSSQTNHGNRNKEVGL